MKKTIGTLILFLLIIIATSWKSFKSTDIPQNNVSFWDLSSPWVDKMLDSMTLDQKIGQLFMIPVYPQKPDTWEQTEYLIKNYHVGGIILFKGSPETTANLVNRYQNISGIPLLVAIDAEWGLSMRIDSTLRYPFQMTLGAIPDDRLIFEMGKQIGEQLKALGINVSFAPVVDINTNPENPVIGVRSFGQNPVNVAAKGFAYAAGLQQAGVLAVAKHFPGHGDTDKDSHKDLPVVKYNYPHLYNTELYPFRQLIKTNISGIMVAHLYVPAIDEAVNTPATLSRRAVKGLLRDSLHFKGLIFTDALDMQGVSKYFGPGEAEIRALLAGNDVLLMSTDVPRAFNRIKQAVLYGEIPESVIDSAVKRILMAKAWAGLYRKPHIQTANLHEKLVNDSAKVLIDKLYRSAITIVKNQDSLLPIKHLENYGKIAAVSIGDGKKDDFLKYLGYYAKIDKYAIHKNAPYQNFVNLRNRLEDYDLVIIGIKNTNNFATKTYGISENALWFTARLAEKTNVILDVFANPYALNRFPNLKAVKAILVSYEDTKPAQRASAQIIFGGFGAQGRLPVDTRDFKCCYGIQTQQIRLNYKSPAELGINVQKLKRIDTIIRHAIDSGAFPGCQILAIKDTSVFFYKAYGYYTYKRRIPVTDSTIYDIASITKVAATTLALMKLYEQGKFDIYAKMSDYLPSLDTTNKANIKIIDVLTHQARLFPWIPFYLHTYLPHSKRLDPALYKHSPQPGYTTQVARNLYILDSYRDSMYREIYESRLLRRKKYRYSDLGFYLFQRIIEQETGTTLDSFVTGNFYIPLGAYTTRFRPLQYFPASQIAPTEQDTYFRHQLVQGYVHDYGAAMLGGVAGHAGLFSNANDLAKIFQMLLQNGYYADRRYFQPYTVSLFTTKPFKRNHRALGFDSKNGDDKSLAAPSASKHSYGHTGFTGTMVWVDPEYNFIYVFLSNRVYPTIKNNKINHLHVRTRVHETFYKAFNTNAK